MFRNAMFIVLFFAGVMLINGIIANLLIGFLQSVGLWEVSVPPASGHAGLTVGDITVGSADAPLEPRYIEILPVAGVRIVAERHLIGLLADGASLAWAPHLMGRHLAIRLARPERWIAFLESHPRTR